MDTNAQSVFIGKNNNKSIEDISKKKANLQGKIQKLLNKNAELGNLRNFEKTNENLNNLLERIKEGNEDENLDEIEKQASKSLHTCKFCSKNANISCEECNTWLCYNCFDYDEKHKMSYGALSDNEIEYKAPIKKKPKKIHRIKIEDIEEKDLKPKSYFEGDLEKFLIENETIKEYRDKVLLTQVELAEKLGVSYASVNRWEKGTFEPTMKIRRKLKKLFEEAGIKEE